MNKFFDADYLVRGSTARTIYEAIEGEPIYDYHSHLRARDILEDIPYTNITSMWLDDDHYKWRLMRMAGVTEEYITGGASKEDKFKAFASVMPLFIGNPVYDWAHMELRRYFDIDAPLSADTAREIYDATSSVLRVRGYSPRRLLSMANVDTLMTTDDPLDDLRYHEELCRIGYAVRVVPTFRADKILAIDDSGFREYIDRLEESTNIDILDMDSLARAMENRLDYFISHGSMIADISISEIPTKGSLSDANSALRQVLAGGMADNVDAYRYEVLRILASLFSRYDIVMQFHLGAIRNVNTMRYHLHGGDSGIDSIGRPVDIVRLGALLDAINSDGVLPRTIIYTMNESSYAEIATMLGNFAGRSRGSLQLGAAWWMMDSREGIERQLTIFKNTGGLGYFNGMLTDSRSYTSFVRHDYFRRILSSFIGKIIDEGGVRREDGLAMAQSIAYHNAKRYFDRREV